MSFLTSQSASRQLSNCILALASTSFSLPGVAQQPSAPARTSAAPVSPAPTQAAAGPSLRILSTRTAAVESSGATLEQAGSSASSTGSLLPPSSQRPSGLVKTPSGSSTTSTAGPSVASASSPASSPANRTPPTALRLQPPRPTATDPVRTAQSIDRVKGAISNGQTVASIPRPDVARVPEPGSPQAKRIAAMQRVSVMNQARGPRDAGVPQAIGPQVQRALPVARSAAPAPPGADPKLAAAPASPAASAPSYDPMSPVPGKALPDADPMASEVARSGDYYYFSGAINGTAVRFRINESVNGIRIPSRIASAVHAIPAEARLPTSPNAEIVAPVSTILFGSYPVRSVMARIIVTDQVDYVDVGLDALANFKIKNLAGRRLLVRG